MQYRITVEELCRKLKPIFGKKIDMLYLKYTMAEDREQKQEIESALNVLYQKHLNSSLLNDVILLEPPTEELINGDYPLGMVSYADKDLYQFGLRERDWPRHMCVTGMSGSGKTTFAYQVLGNLMHRKKPFLVFDWKKSFRSLMLINENVQLFTVGDASVSNYFKVNINKPPRNVHPREWINMLCDIIVESFFASYGVHKLLSEVLDKAFRQFGVYEGSQNYPTWYQLKDMLEQKEASMKGGKSREGEWLTSALRIAHVLTFGAFGEAINYKGRDMLSVEELLAKQSIFELNSLNNPEKKFFCQFILTYIYKMMKANYTTSGDFKSAILVDEAHNIFLKERPNFMSESITDVIYREIREYGIGLVCLDQHMSKLSDVVAGNSACNIAFQQFLPQDVEAVSSLMMLRENKKYFTMLPVGQAIVRLAERFFSPFLIKCPDVPLKKKIITNEFVARKMAEKIKYVKRVKFFNESCDTGNLRKKMDRLESIYKHTGVKPIREFIQEQAKQVVQEEIKKEFNETKSHSFIPKPTELTEDHKKFLHTLQENPGLPTSQLYKLLKLSARKGDKLKKELIEMDLISVEELRDKSGWRKVLHLTGSRSPTEKLGNP